MGTDRQNQSKSNRKKPAAAFLHCCSFCVNIGPSESDFTLHINPRFSAHGDENVVVCNSYQGGSWGEEVREGGFPFKQGEKFTVRLPRRSLGSFLPSLPSAAPLTLPWLSHL